MKPSLSLSLLSTQSDSRLVELASAGHELAFEALVRRYRRALLGYCRRMLLSPDRCEDVLQQAFLRAWVALSDGTEVLNAKPWLYRIVHNTALNALRACGYDYCTLSESLSGADAPQADLDRRIAVREALAGLAALPEMQREALLRTAVEGATHQQAARDLGLSEPALRGLVYRARSTLRSALTALTPPPLLNWALESGLAGSTVNEHAAELGAGGIAALLAKTGAVTLTAGALFASVGSIHHRPVISIRDRSSHAREFMASNIQMSHTTTLKYPRPTPASAGRPSDPSPFHGRAARHPRALPRRTREYLPTAYVRPAHSTPAVSGRELTETTVEELGTGQRQSRSQRGVQSEQTYAGSEWRSLGHTQTGQTHQGPPSEAFSQEGSRQSHRDGQGDSSSGGSGRGPAPASTEETLPGGDQESSTSSTGGPGPPTQDLHNQHDSATRHDSDDRRDLVQSPPSEPNSPESAGEEPSSSTSGRQGQH